MKRIFLFIPIFLAFIFLFVSITPTIVMSENIAQKVFRLHILANSNEQYDQQLKLKVRDEILEQSKFIFSNCKSLDDAICSAKNNINYFESTARRVIKNNGYNYDVKVKIDKEYFDVRDYKDFSLPAGIYNCIRIVIGEGSGKNWWCVMYPSVCLTGCTDDFDNVLTDKEIEAIKSNKYIAKFKALEIIEKIKSRLI